MEISNGWYQVRIALEATLDHLFDLRPAAFFEFDSLLSIDEMNSLGYVRNFPHLTCLMCSIKEGQHRSFATGDSTLSAGFQPSGTDMALLPAACYKVYMGLSGQRLDAPRVVGCIAKCFRHEDKVLDAYRALNFTMKEFVCLGNADDAQRHITRGFAQINRLMDHLGIQFACEVASDPFFDSTSSLAMLSKLSPTKQEILFQGHAVASMNFHRNYFGDKFDIRMADQPVNTSCVAFGIERWISMFKDMFETPQNAMTALASAGFSRAPTEMTSFIV